MGYKNKLYAERLKEALQVLAGGQSLAMGGVLLSHPHPNLSLGLEYLIREGVIKQTNIVIPASSNPSTYLPSAAYEELSRLPLDHPSTFIEDKELFKELSLRFHFQRKYPLIRYSVTQKKEQTGGEKQLVFKDSSAEVNENNVLLQIKPSHYSNVPSVLITGDPPVHHISKIDHIDSEPHSVFMVPHQESRECFSLLPEGIRKQLSSSESIENASLYLALYHRRESFGPYVDRLKESKLKKDTKFFHFHSCNPEADLATMLQNPEVKLNHIFGENFNLDWYKNQKEGEFLRSATVAVTEEEKKQQRRFAFFRDSLAWAHFYKDIRAEVYVMSAEDLKQEPRLEVLNGIIIANMWRGTECCIILTDSLPYSLDEVIQRDVRKLVFPDDGSKPSVHIGYLDKNSPNCARNVPFFTIDPWSQGQQHCESQYHTVSVDTSRHHVSGLGDEPRMNLIRDELDIKVLISTKLSNMLVDSIAHSHRPRLGSGQLTTAPLESYLRSIGYKITYTSYNLDTVLDCLIGPSLVVQLRNLSSKDVPGSMGIIPVLLKHKATGSSGGSVFDLTPTKCSASSAVIGVFISPKRPLHVGDKTVKRVTLTVKKARTMSVQITLRMELVKCSNGIALDLSQYLNLNGSCGKTVADYIYGICFKEEAWLTAKKMTVGEVLHVFLHEEKAAKAIQSLPLFLSFPLSKCKIKHYLTTVLMDSSHVLQEAHIHIHDPLELSPVFVNQCKLRVKITSLVMHVLPSRDIDDRMIQIEGDCIVNGILMKFTCSSSTDVQKHVEFFFGNTLPAKEVLEFVGINAVPTSFSSPVSDCSLDNKITYKGGFILSQLFGSTVEVSFTSLFFNIELCNIGHLLPDTLSHDVQNTQVKVTVHFPTTTPKLGLEASFTSTVKVPGCPEVESVTLDCFLSVCPAVISNSYTYKVMVKPYSRLYEPQKKLEGSSVYGILSALNSTLGGMVAEEVRKIPTLGHQILSQVSLRKIMALQDLNKEVQSIELHAAISELEIIPCKLAVNDCILKISYSRKGLELECEGNLVFLRQYTYSVKLSLPTVAKKGRIEFRSYSNDLILRDVLLEFGWLSCDAKSNPVLASALDIAVRKVAIEFHFPPEGQLQITAAEVSIFKEELDIGLVIFKCIELDTTVKLVNGQYVTAFSLGAYISDALYARLQYDPDNCILSGKISVALSKSVAATAALQTFQLSISSFNSMKCILQDDFMQVFQSKLNIMVNPGMTAFLSVSIGFPSKHSKQYSLEHLNLEIKDALKICRKDSYILNTFQFEYYNMPRSKDIASTSHLMLAVHKLNSKENMSLNFDLTSKRDSTSFLTAKVEAGPQGGLLKLKSAIDLAQAASPELPKFDIGLPPIFGIELLSGSVSFTLSPFQPCAFDVTILIDNWRVFVDPELTVHKLKLKTTWESGSYPQLTFTDCSLTFLEHELFLSGKLTSEEVLIKCRSANQLPESTPTQFKSILENYTPRSQPQPILPTNIGLPSMEIELKELVIHLKEATKSFRLNTRVLARSPWTIEFGSRTITVHELGGALEWEKSNDKTHYKAFLYGSIELFGIQVDMEMLLGKGVDSIISATISQPQHLHYGQIADHLLASDEMTACDPESSSLSDLVPATMQELPLMSASSALNITKKQFFLSSRVQGWGVGSLLVGYLLDERDMDYVVSLSLDEDFTFGKLSDSLAFIDDLIILRSMNLLISSATLHNLSALSNQFCHSFSRSQVHEQLMRPFYESKLFNSTMLAGQPLRKGTTVYAEIDLFRSKGGISKVLELGDSSLLEHHITIMTYVGEDFKSATNKNLEIHAWIPRIRLFQMLEFSDIHMLYKVSKASEFELSGIIVLSLDLETRAPFLKFAGNLSVTPTVAKFSTVSCRDAVCEPVGIRVTVKDLALKLKKELKGGRPDVCISGRIQIGCVPLTCKFLLKGVTFKVFQIQLDCGLMLSVLFSCSRIEWPVTLDIGIKGGEFYYANSYTEFEEDGRVCKYQGGYHLEAVITVLNSDFRIMADIPSDRSKVSLSGRSVDKIDFGFVKFAGERPHDDEGPELKYSDNSLSLILGVEILKKPWFEGELTYKSKEEVLEGKIAYQGRILWLENPSMKVRWSKSDGFEIVEFPIFGDMPFSLLGAIAKFAKIIYNLVTGLLRYEIKLHLRTGKNPNPDKYFVKLVLTGEICVTVIGFITIPFFPLPEVPILLRKVDNLSFSNLPKYILSCLWDSAKEICMSLLRYLNPWDLAKRMGKMIIDGVTGAIKAVLNVGKKVVEGAVKVVKKAWSGIKSFFGWSAFVVDVEEGMVLGYICGGRGGRKLHDERYIVEHFGPFLAANAVRAMAHDVHRHYKACIDAQAEDNSEDDRVPDEQTEEHLKSLNELERQTQDLSANLNILADEVLTVKGVCIAVDEDGKSILIEWVVCNPVEGIVYSEDKGDIEYHVKVTATVIEGMVVKTMSIYEEVFTKLVKSTDSEESQSQTVEATQGDTERSVATQETQGDKKQTVAVEEATQDDKEQTVAVDEVTQGDTEHSVATQEATQGDKKQTVAVEEATKGDTEHNIATQGDKKQAAENLEDDKRQHFEDKETEFSDNQEGDGKSNESLSNKCISLKVPFDANILESTVCICVSIQPKVSLRVKTLPPDKIGTPVDREDPLWMENTKKEIEDCGRINEVTLHGKKLCQQQLIKPDSESEIQFTAQCDHEKNSLTISGDITPVAGTECYLVRVVDKADQIVIVKQKRLLSHELHYSFEMVPSDFPDTSSGPYHVSVIALRADLSTCSSFTDSELEIVRHPPPEGLTQTLPNFDSSESDIVRLEWKLLKSSEYKEDTSKDLSGDPKLSEDPGPDPELSEDLSPDPELSEDIIKPSPGSELSEDAVSGSDTELSEYSYIVTITGVCAKKPRTSRDYGDPSTDNIDTSEQQVLHMSVPVHIEKDSEKQQVDYEFSLDNILKNNKNESAILFRCQVSMNGVSKLPSMPKSFAEFILLAPPAELAVSTPVRKAWPQISWVYSAHAVSYRIELVNEETEETVFSKVQKCETGSHGHAILDKNDLKDIPCTSNGGYRLQMFSLGFGQDLIRCLSPTVAVGTFHVIPAELQYLEDSNVVRVKFRPFTDVNVTYIVELYHVMRDKDEALCLTTRCIEDIRDEIVEDFPLKKWRHIFQSGDVTLAWVHSSPSENQSISYIGAPKEELCFMNSPILKASPYYECNWTVSGLNLIWSEVVKAEKYQYGYYLPGKGDYITLMDTQETQASISYIASSLSHFGEESCQFHCYVAAVGKPGVLAAGELSLDACLFQCIKSQSLEGCGEVIFTSISLQRAWSNYLIGEACSHYYPLFSKPRHLLFPSGKPFPHLNIHCECMNKFWEAGSPLFGSGYMYACDILEAKAKKKWKNVKVEPFAFVKPGQGFTEFHLLFYTRCIREPEARKNSHCQIEIEIKIETTCKGKTATTQDTGTEDSVSAADPTDSLGKESSAEELDTTSTEDSVTAADPTDSLGKESSAEELDTTSTEDAAEPTDLCEAHEKGSSTEDTTAVVEQLSSETDLESDDKNEPVKFTGFLKKGARYLKGMASNVAAKVASYVTGRNEKETVYSKKMTIVLPHGKKPKTCRLLIRHVNCQLRPLTIFVSMKPTGRCHYVHQKTHLFMTFV